MFHINMYSLFPIRYMFLFVLLLCTVVRAEWPPSSCAAGIDSKDDMITLTGSRSSSDIYSCSFSENFQNTVYFEVQRYYTGNEKRYQHSRDSSMSFNVKTSSNDKFDLQIHNDRIESSLKTRGGFAKRCFGIFKRKENWFIRLRLHAFIDMQKTVVDVATSRGNQYKDCFQFELDSYVDFFKLDVHASTETGMTQRLHSVQTNILGQDGEKTKLDIVKIQADVQNIQERLKDIEENMRVVNIKVTQSDVQHIVRQKKMEENHNKIKETVKKVYKKTANKLQNHSYITYLLFALSALFIAVWFKFLKNYIQKRDHIC